MTTYGDSADSSPGCEQVVTSLKPTDVLFGRGSGPNDHEGNILFRSLVRERKSEYMATNHRPTKAKIAREIVDTVLARSGRFLKKIDPAEAKELGIPADVDVWTLVDEKTIMEKAKQALRQKTETGGCDTPPDQHSSHEGASLKVTPRIPEEILSAYADETLEAHGRCSPPQPGNMRHSEAHWNTGYDDQIPMYVSSQERRPGAYISAEEAHSHRMAELDHERHAEMNVQQHLSAVYNEEVPDCMDDDARRGSLSVEDLIRSFHRVGTDEAGTSQSGTSSSNVESAESMGTIEPLPMGASNISLMSMSSLFKNDTPRSSLTQGGRSLSSRFSYDSSFRTHGSRRSSHTKDDGSRRSSYTKDDSALSFRRPSYQRELSGRTMYTDHSEDNDMSISLSHIDDLGGNGGPRTGHSVSLVLEGMEGEEEASRVSLSFDPRSVQQMREHPDNLDEMGDSSKNLICGALSFDPRSVQQMREHPDNLDEMGDSSKNLIYGALGTSSSALSGAETHEYHT